MKKELSSICDFAKDKIEVDTLNKKTYISTENMLPDKSGISDASSLPTIKLTPLFKKNDILISNIRPYFKKIWYAEFDGGCSNDVLILRAKPGVHEKFLYYVLSEDTFFDYATATAKGTKMPRGDKAAIMKYLVPDISYENQEKIAKILSSLDDKISLNTEITKNLEHQAQSIFKSWFIDFDPFNGAIPEEWSDGNLLDIADYLNGLAMQKFRPEKNENYIPVMKIKELRQGICDSNSDLCSQNIKSEYIIKNGDVIFSWSGTLLVDIWCGGTCGLNQHLFKVTSTNYDKWFYYMWTNYHLQKFIFVAADKATTMGHIKRDELEKSKVLIPTDGDYKKISALMSPIIDNIILNKIENNNLAQLRSTLLPKLLNGEIDVSEVVTNDTQLFVEGQDAN